jgi:acyl carrier protein
MRASFSRALSPDSIGETVRDIVCRMSGRADVSDFDDLYGVLLFDDYELLDLLMAVQLAIGVEFLQSEASDIETVGDLITRTVNKMAYKFKAENSPGSIKGDAGLREAIQDMAEGAARSKRAIDLTTAPDLLKMHFPTAALSPHEIAEELRRQASRRGASVTSGRR